VERFKHLGNKIVTNGRVRKELTERIKEYWKILPII
jgi:short-subunit dehydrogenase involved in D-alanine esterification of teichoic acids